MWGEGDNPIPPMDPTHTTTTQSKQEMPMPRAAIGFFPSNVEILSINKFWLVPSSWYDSLLKKVIQADYIDRISRWRYSYPGI